MSKLRYGIFLAPHHPVDEDPTWLMHRDLELMEWIDRLGYDEAWIGEHHSGGYETISSPEIFIAAAAERTKRLKLGMGVISLPFHNPLVVANRVIQLDHQTRGRVMFGAGPGLLESDAWMMGIDPLDKRDRLEQSLAVILRLFRGETVTEKTDWYELRDAHCHVLPYTDPYPEVAVASVITPSGGRLAGRHGLSMLCLAALGLGFDALSTNWKVAQDVAGQRGATMDPSCLRLVVPMHIAETREKARENLKYGFDKWLAYQKAQDPSRYPIPDGANALDWYLQKDWGVVGTPEDAVRVIERLQEKTPGFGYFCQHAVDWADFAETKKSYELFARYVMPHFSRANPSRQRSLDFLRDNQPKFIAQQRQAAKAMFDKHEREAAERKQKAAA
jgi:limonene 1,2-monooxygenase